MEELTPEQFKEQFGLTPEQYKAANPNKVQTRSGISWHQETPTLETPRNKKMRDRYVQEINDIPSADPMAGIVKKFMIDKEDSKLNWEQTKSNMMSGVLQIPSEVLNTGGTLYEVGRAIPGVSSRDGSFMENLVDNIFPEELRTEIDSKVEAFATEAVTKYPDLTQSQLQDLAIQYYKSDEIRDIKYKGQNWWTAIPAMVGDEANRIAGSGKRIDEHTMRDDVEQIVGQALVMPPAAAMKGMRRGFAKVVGSAVDKHMATRIALKVAELVTPVTLPGTLPNAAANIVVGAGITEGMRYIEKVPSVFNGGVFFDNEEDFMQDADEEALNASHANPHLGMQDPTADIKSAAESSYDLLWGTGSALAASGGLLGILKYKPKLVFRSKDAEIVHGLDPQKAGLSLAERSEKLDPVLRNTPLAGVGDINSPIKKLAQKADEPNSAVLLDYELSNASAVSVGEHVTRAIRYGEIEDFKFKEPPLKILEDVNRLTPEQKHLLNNNLFAKSRMDDEVKKFKVYDANIKQLKGQKSLAQTKGNTKEIPKIEKRMQAFKDMRARLAADDPISRSSMRSTSRSDFEAAMREAAKDREVTSLTARVNGIANDVIKWQAHIGRISKEDYIARLNDRPHYLPTQEIRHANIKNPIIRTGRRYLDSFDFRKPKEMGAKLSGKGRDLSEGNVDVDIPMLPLDAINYMIKTAIHEGLTNKAKLNVIDMLYAMPKIRGKAIKQHTQKGPGGKPIHSWSVAKYYSRPTKTNQLTGKQEAIGSLSDKFEGMKKTRNIIEVYRNGRIEVYEFADKAAAFAVEFAPNVTIPFFHETRKAFQWGTTGSSPFALPFNVANGMFIEPFVGKWTMVHGRSFGLGEYAIRRLAAGTSLDKGVSNVMDYASALDITMHPTAWLGMGYGASMRAYHGAAKYVFDTMSSNSPIIKAMAKASPEMHRNLLKASESAIKTFDSSAYGIQIKHIGSSASFLNEGEQMIDAYARKANDGLASAATRNAVRFWKGALESVQQGARTSYWWQNYSILKARYGGADKIPKQELKKLTQDFRNFSSDVTRQSGSKIMQGTTDVFGFSNAILQGTRHVLAASIPAPVAKGANALGANMLTDRTNRFWPHLLTTMFIPYMGMLTFLDSWEGALDYYDNKLSAHDKGNYFYVPSLDAIAYKASKGVWPKFQPEHLNSIRFAPDAGLFIGPFMAFVRSTGVMGIDKPKYQTAGDMFKQTLRDNFDTPPVPLIDAFAAFTGTRIDLQKVALGEGGITASRTLSGGGANGDYMTFNSSIPQKVFEMLGGFVGGTSDIVMQSMNVGEIKYKESESAWEAFTEAFDTMQFEVKRRMPNIDLPGGLYAGRTKLSTYNTESNYVYNATRELDPIFGANRQLTVERDSKGYQEELTKQGYEVAKKISDPILRNISLYLWDQMKKKGPFKEAKEGYSAYNTKLTAIEASRHKKPDDHYLAERNQAVKVQQQFMSIQAKELLRMHEEINNSKVGKQFEQKYEVPFSFQNLADLVRENVK